MGTLLDKANRHISAVQQHERNWQSIFVEFSPERIRAAATDIEARSSRGENLPLYGLLVSLKDLFDEQGQRTTAASRLLATRPAATSDADIVQRLTKAGALCFGRTAMTEFAYSGVGLNPHYGTPGNVFDNTLIPGGSTSGGALTVALGWCDLAIGTDTGGSVRIPAALNGLFGIKPTQSTVSRRGVHALSDSFDSVGPLAANLDTALRCHAVLSNKPADFHTAGAPPERVLRLAVPAGAFSDALDPSVAAGYTHVQQHLRAAGHSLESIDLTELSEASAGTRIIVATEAHQQYHNDLNALATVGDPRVLSRIHTALSFSAEQVSEAYAQRERAITILLNALTGFDALIAPTVAIETPGIERAEREFDAVNAMMLRNCALINLADGCAVSLPFSHPGDSPTPGALMIAGASGADDQLLAIARQISSQLD